MPIRSLGYLHIQTPEAEAWRSFGADVLGFMPTDLGDGSIAFRWDERPFRLVVSSASERAIGAIGFEVADDFELAEVMSRLEEAGVKVALASESEAAERRVSGLAKFEDPAGVPIELFYSPILTHERVVTPLVSGFVTGRMGMGHVVVGTEEAAATTAFYREVLGFHRRNTMKMGPFSMHFMGCNPRHHTLGVAGFPVPGNLLHFMVEAATIDDVGMALDRCSDAGVPITMSLGKHTNDQMISFYCQTPDGGMVEYGWGGIHVDDVDEETTYEITAVSFWGHRPPKA